MSSILFIAGSIVLFIFILSALVIIHELGHFIVAKRFGIRVDEFGLGYPPRAAKLFSRGGTDFTLNWLPFGGFVKIYGEDPTEEHISGPEHGNSFIAKPKYAQALVLLAGVAMNFLAGWLLVSILYMAGTHILFDDTVNPAYLVNTHLIAAQISPGFPADKAFVMPGDEIAHLSYAKDPSHAMPAYTPEALTAFVRGSGGEPLRFDLIRQGNPISITVTPRLTDSRYVVGISPELDGYIHTSFFRSFALGFHSTIFIVKSTWLDLVGLVQHKVGIDTVSGPVGMVSMVGAAARMGIEYVILFAALISLSLAVINLVPFPALDGGRLLFVIIEAVIRRPIPPKFANVANTLGFFILIALMLFVTYHDIVKLI